MADPGRLIKRGAEAEIWARDFFGLPAVEKRRLPRRYRIPELDNRLRRERTKKEAYLLRLAREAGVRTPIVYDIDLVECTITMEFLEGDRAKEYLYTHEGQDARELCRMMGREVAKLHNAGMVHGDLTTSNIILIGDIVAFIDLGLGSNNVTAEDMAVDLHSFREAYESTHPNMADGWDSVMEGYLSSVEDPATFEKAYARVESRGRYR